MPLILVVDRDERVPKRVRQSLGSEGWTVTHVRDVTEALQSAGSEAPDLFLVAAELPSARNLLGTFARRQGGPGTLALVPEGADTAGAAEAGLGEDAILSRSFEDAELRAAVEAILRTPDRPVRPRGDEPKLTSHDIFGDLVAEVERETGVREPVPPKVAAAAPPAPPAARRRVVDDDVERKLEQTLSGVLGMSLGAKAAPPRRPASQRPASSRAGGDDLDKLISDTLSGLDLPAGAPRKRRPPAEAGPATGAAAPAPAPPAAKPGRPAFDFSELEALVGRSKRPAEPPAAPKAAPPPAPRPAPAGPPPEIPAARPALPFGALFADDMQEVPEAEADERVKEAQAGAPGRGGREFGQYHLLDRIGVGGMAEVWKARMRGLEGFQKTVAIKRILPHLTDSPDFVEMFVDEAKLAAQLNHANIIHIYDLGKLGDDYYIAMEYVEGQNLREILNRARERGGALPPGIALHIAARLASALDYAHRKRDFEDRELELVHRDVSPQNVLVGYEGTIKLCDFGIVKAVSKSSHTQMGALKGKLQYMSPEQAWGRAVDGRSDIFAVGCLLFEMLTGRRLFVGETELEVLEAVRECRVQAPTELQAGLDPTIDEVVLKALAREPELRFQTAGELERRLEEILASLRPTPGQSELSTFMARLFDRAPQAEPSAEASAAPPAAASPEPPPKQAAPAPAAASAPAAVPAPGADLEPGADESQEPAPEAAPGPTPEPAPLEAVEAVSPVREVVAEEGGRRGKGLLVAAIVAALVVGGLLAWYLLRRGGTGDGVEVLEPGPPPAAVTEPVSPPPAPADAAGAAPPEGEAAAGETSAEGGDAAASPVTGNDLTKTIDRAVEEGLARREEVLRRQFEEEERRLQRQLEQLQESAREEEAAVEAVEGSPPEPEPSPPPGPGSL